MRIIRGLSNFTESIFCDKALSTSADSRKTSRRGVYSAGAPTLSTPAYPIFWPARPAMPQISA